METRCSTIESEIARLESQIQSHEAHLLTFRNADDILRLTTERDQLRTRITELTTEWDALAAQLDELQTPA